MTCDQNIIRVLESTTQSGAKMTEAFSILGNGRMGDGVLRFAEWAKNEGKLLWLNQGRFQGAAVTGIAASVVFATLYSFMRRQFEQAHKEDQDAVFDLIDANVSMHNQLVAAKEALNQQRNGEQHIKTQKEEN